MILSNLMIITGYDKFYPTILQCCSHLDIEPRIFQWEKASPRMVSRLQEDFIAYGRPEVIISRGALADIVENSFPDIINFRAEPDDIDMLQALETAKSYGKKIGVLMFMSSIRNYKLDVLKRILNLDELRFYTFQSADDIRSRVAEGKQDGMDAMVGGGTLAIRTGRQLGIPVCFAESSARSLEHALLQALTIINARKKERHLSETFWNATTLVCEGILVIENNRISMANHEMLHILAAGEKDILNHLLEDLTPEYFSKELFHFFTDEMESEKICSVCGCSYLIKKRRLVSEEQCQITAVFQNIADIQRQEQQVRAALRKKGLAAAFTFSDIKGNSVLIKSLCQKASLYAATDASILISGDNGTGKELFAQSIHNASIRKNNPFVAVNCAAIPESLIESELFGYEEGSFSGARRGGHPGLFEQAHKGTLFLDEINSLPFHIQGTLLRAIQEKEVRRIGSQKILAVDVRLISATNMNMDHLIKDGKFRSDLYYRLNVLNLSLPRLTERKEDILPLASMFLSKYSRRYHIEIPPLTKEDQALLLQASWTGNVRELENVIHRYVILSKCQNISIRDCMETTSFPPAECPPESETICIAPGTLDEMEKEVIRIFLEKNNGNRSQTANELGISRTTLWKKIST